MGTAIVKYLEVAGSGSQELIQSLLDQMAREGFELFQVIPNIDDRRGNPSVTAGMFLFFKAAAAGTMAQ